MTTCPTCSASTLAPLVEGGVNTRKLQERVMRIAKRIRTGMATDEDAASLQALSDTLGWPAAERVRLLNERDG